jgi:flagellar hook-basal body complex protein FliE
MTIDPTSAVSGASSIGSIGSIGSISKPPAATEGGSSFGSMLTDSIKSLEATQTEAASAAQELATGKATDPTAVVMAVERAQLSMQMASQIRTKAVEAVQTIFQTQV